MAAAAGAQTSLVDQVRALSSKGDFAGADRLVEAYRARAGADVDYAFAVSWEGRNALAQKQLDRAEQYADRARDASLALLKKRKLDAEKTLPLALGGVFISLFVSNLSGRSLLPVNDPALDKVLHHHVH